MFREFQRKFDNVPPIVVTTTEALILFLPLAIMFGLGLIAGVLLCQ